MGKKFPYTGYTESEIRNMEENFYLLRFGGDFIREDNCHFFTKAEIAKIYEKTLKDLVTIIRDGSNKDRDYALQLIGSLVIQQMRLH